ncbi:hypothetical protein [Thiothrix lacustris]|uniref:hypothetical protein n=1 Tax=Thiothrix lacustris TaxID=525917 RepID=UPI00049099E5|nr:hypothetical protein [Thiothrix lacustris]
MENLNTNQTVDYSQTRVIELMRSMSIENQRILLQAVEAMVATTPKTDVTGALQDVRAILDILLNADAEALTDGNTTRILAGIAYDKVLMIQGDAA